MGRKRTPGLVKRGNVWHINKRVDGQRLCESTGTTSLKEAEKYLAHRIEAMRQAHVYGVRPRRVFREAATKYLMENQHKKSINRDATNLKILDPLIGDLLLESIHMGTLQPYIQARQEKECKNRTTNYGLQIVRHILNLAATEWVDEYGLTWLLSAPKIKLLPLNDARKPYPLNWDEQEKLFNILPDHLKNMAIFAVNTGCRDQEICKLKWSWETRIPKIGSIFIIPGQFTKNGEDRLIVLNQIAQEVIEKQRGKHPEFVFVYKGQPMTRMLNKGWLLARQKTGLPVRVHDLKHTFGRRLRAAGVSFEDRQDLLGHKSGRITTHYSAAELSNLITAANKVCEKASSENLTILRVAHCA